MVAATPAQLRAGIATYLTTQIPGLRSIQDGETGMEPPCVMIIPDTGKYIDYHVAFGGQVLAATYLFRLIIFISKADVRSGTIQLDNYLSPHGSTSLVQALLTDPTCGGIADYVMPQQSSWSGNVEYGGQEYMAGTMIVEAAAE